MGFFGEGLRQGWHLLVTGDPYLWHLIWITVLVALISTGVALVLGVPLGLIVGIGRFRGRGIAHGAANVGLALPPVFVGLVLTLLMFPESPLGSWHLLFTLHGVYLAQTLLALPIVVALTAAAMRNLPDGLLDQARAYGAGRWQTAALALAEARAGVLVAAIAAVGSALSEVGAVVLVGGNIHGVDQTLASAALEQVDAGNFAEGFGIGIVLLGLMVLVIGSLTVLQVRSRTRATPLRLS